MIRQSVIYDFHVSPLFFRAFPTSDTASRPEIHTRVIAIRRGEAYICSPPYDADHDRSFYLYRGIQGVAVGTRAAVRGRLAACFRVEPQHPQYRSDVVRGEPNA